MVFLNGHSNNNNNNNNNNGSHKRNEAPSRSAMTSTSGAGRRSNHAGHSRNHRHRGSHRHGHGGASVNPSSSSSATNHRREEGPASPQPSSTIPPTNSNATTSGTPDWTAETVAALPPPGLSGPTGFSFSPMYGNMQQQQLHTVNREESVYLAFVSTLQTNSSSSSTQSTVGAVTRSHSKRRGTNSNKSIAAASSGERQLCILECNPSSHMLAETQTIAPLLKWLPSHSSTHTTTSDSLEEKLRRERQRLQNGGSVTQFSWINTTQEAATAARSAGSLRVLVPHRGNVYVQEGVGEESETLQLVYDKHQDPHKGTGAIDAQLSPDGTMVAFVLQGDIHVAAVPARGQPQADSGTDYEEDATMRRRVRIGGTTTVSASTSQAPPPPVQITFGAQPQQHRPQPEQSTAQGSTDTASNPQQECITHGLADFVAQEEMDRYRGYWWSPDSRGILFTRVDETHVPLYRITHQGRESSSNAREGNNYYEDHRYPFAGQANPTVQLGFVKIDKERVISQQQFMASLSLSEKEDTMEVDDSPVTVEQDDQQLALENWHAVQWLSPPREATEYLARVSWLPDGSAAAQWQNRTQSTLVLCRMDLNTNKTRTLLVERSEVWINLHHMMHALPRAVHPSECGSNVEEENGDSTEAFTNLPNPLPEGSFSFLFASERTGYIHLYLYTFVPGYNSDRAILLRTVSSGEWMVESIVGVDMEHDVVYVMGTYDSPLERHLYALPIRNIAVYADSFVDEDGDVSMESSSTHGQQANGSGGMRRGLKSVMSALSGAAKPPGFRLRGSSRSEVSISDASEGRAAPLRLTVEPGMHTICMDDDCRIFVDSSSDLTRPNQVKVYAIPEEGPFAASATAPTTGTDETNSPAQFLFTIYDATGADKNSLIPSADSSDRLKSLPPPEFLSYPTGDGTETLHAALYRPDVQIHGPGPYPLVCAVYGGPHVQRVNRSWSQCADMRAQRLRALGFAVVKCDNRGSSRRGLAFEGAIRGRLGRLEVLDQVATVRQLTMRGIADSSRVGIYGWSYGGYLSAMCLCRAPDVFHVAVAGAPVTSWDGYDTHYTERYMGLPADNASGYRESAVLDHVPNMRGNLMIVHGLIDENVHFRHSARLINRLIAAGKDYDLLIFPDERHSPRRLRDRIYMEQRISDYFLRHLRPVATSTGSLRTTGGGSSSPAYPPGGSSAVRTMPGHL